MRLPIARGFGRSRPTADEVGGAGSAPAFASSVLRYPWWRLVAGLGVLLVIAVVAASQGPVSMPPITVAEILFDRVPGIEFTQTWPDTWDRIIWRLRLPRIVLAGIVGAALAMAGAAYQGLFRNPLADPYLIGVASGAGLGAVIVLVTGVPFFFYGISLLPVAAFVGATLAAPSL